MSFLGRYWGARFDRWGPRLEQQPGYSLLVPVPGDLPVLLELALEVLSRQDTAGRVETIVIPDVPTEQTERIVARHAARWSGPLRITHLPRPERGVLPRLRNPSRNHGVQLIAGVGQSRGEFVVLHDADLFLLAPDLLDARAAWAATEDLDVLGVDPAWDTWFAERDIHLAATWEMIARTDWVRSFPPSMHMGHDGEIRGQKHTFDTVLHPQAVSDPRRRRVEPSADMVHFNYVISTYRHFQRAAGSFNDDHFRLLLIRLFIDLFAVEASDYGIPTLDELAAGLIDPTSPVRYPRPGSTTRPGYHQFRQKVDRILDGPWSTSEQRQALAECLIPFDRFYR